MFTMKFIHHGGAKTVISCARYYVYESYPSTVIDIYPTHKEDNPQVFILELSPPENGHAVYEVFVENEAGKTIDIYRALSIAPPRKSSLVE